MHAWEVLEGYTKRGILGLILEKYERARDRRERKAFQVEDAWAKAWEWERI